MESGDSGESKPFWGYTSPESESLSRLLGIDPGQGGLFHDEDPSELLQQAREDRKRYLVKKAEEKRLNDRMFARKKSCLSVAFSICCLALIAITPYVLLAEMDTSSRVGWVGLFLAVFQTAIVFGQARSSVGRESAEREFVTRNFSELEKRNVKVRERLDWISLNSEFSMENTEALLLLLPLDEGKRAEMQRKKAVAALDKLNRGMDIQFALIELGAQDEFLLQEIEKEKEEKFKPFFTGGVSSG